MIIWGCQITRDAIIAAAARLLLHFVTHQNSNDQWISVSECSASGVSSWASTLPSSCAHPDVMTKYLAWPASRGGSATGRQSWRPGWNTIYIARLQLPISFWFQYFEITVTTSCGPTSTGRPGILSWRQDARAALSVSLSLVPRLLRRARKMRSGNETTYHYQF